MGGFLAELGKKLAEHWLSLLVLPGLLYLGGLGAASILGHRHPVDFGRITRQLDAWTTSPGVTSTSGLVLILIATLLGAAGAGLAAQALGSLTERVWLADRWQSWPPPFRRLAESRTKSRQQRWTDATTTYQRQLDAKGAQLAHRTDDVDVDLDEARRAVTRIAQEEPARPSWIGDRVHAVITRLDRDYHLDLATVWPNLWLAMPESTRTEITAARESLGRATTLAGWGLFYLAVGALWWPGLLIEAAARLHTADLARPWASTTPARSTSRLAGPSPACSRARAI